MNDLDQHRFFDYVDGHKSQYIDQLAEAVAYVVVVASASLVLAGDAMSGSEQVCVVPFPSLAILLVLLV